MSLRLLNDAPLVFLQTFGRRHARSVNAFEDGALDETSMLWANRILGNQNDDAVIEISFGNACFLAEKDAHIALVGAEMPFTINGKDFPLQGTHFVRKGDVLKFGFFTRHLRTYLAVRGGFRWSEDFKQTAESRGAVGDIGVAENSGIIGKREVFGNKHTAEQAEHVAAAQNKEAVGNRSLAGDKEAVGNGGIAESPEKSPQNRAEVWKKLKKGDRLFFTDALSTPYDDKTEKDAGFKGAGFARCFAKSVSSKYLPVYQDPLQLRLVQGYQSSLFSTRLQQFFYDQEYLILGHSNSLTYHLSCPQSKKELKEELSRWQLEISPICYGTVSLSFDDEVTVSLRDHFSLSSSPKMGSILPIDAHKLAQLSPGQRVCFLPCDLADAQKVMRSYDSFFALNN